MNHHLRKKARLTSFLRKALKPFFAVCALAPVFGFHTASAQLYWQSLNGAGGTGGAGNWNHIDNSWSEAPATAADQAWTDFHVAVFGGATGGTITINTDAAVGDFGPITANGITFNTNGYVIADDGTPNQLLLNGAATISAAAGITGQISTNISNVNPSDTLTFSGPVGSMVILSGNNTSYQGSTITITGGITVQALQAGVFSGATAIPSDSDFVINSGTLDLNDSNATLATLSTTTTAATPGAIVTNSNTNPNTSSGAAVTYSLLTVGPNTSPSNASFTTFGGTITDTAATIETAANLTPAGGLGLTVLGPGPSGYTLVLTGTNTYHGITTIGNTGSPATLQGGAANAFSPNSVVDVEATGTVDLHGNNEGIAALQGTGTGTVTNSGNTLATLTVGATPTGATPALTGTLISDATLVDGSTGLLGLTKQGVYTQVLSGNNTYSGPTTVTTGTLAAGSATGFSQKSLYTVNGTLDLNGFSTSTGSLTGTGTVVNGSGNVAVPHTGNAVLTVGSATSNLSSTFGGTIEDSVAVGAGGTLALIKAGTGVLTLTGTNTYSAGTTIQAGVLSFGLNSLGSGPLTFAGNSTLQWNGANTQDVTLSNGPVTIAAGVTATFDTNGNPVNFVNALATSAGSAVQKAGGGTLTLNGNNTYNGATTVSAGALKAGTATGFSAASAFTLLTAGTLDVNGLAPTIGSLAGTGTVTNSSLTATPGTLITGNDGTSTTFGGLLQDGTGTLALTKIGAGAMTLSTANTYSGGTTVQAGALVIANMNALGTGNVAVTGGALRAGGVNMRINVGGNYTQSGGGELDLRIGGTTTGSFDHLAVTGTASLAGRLNVAAINGYVPKNGDSIPVITATSVGGQFGQVTGNLTNVPMVKLTVAYLSNQVLLNFSQQPFTNIPTAATVAGIPTATPFIQLTPNEKAVAEALDHLSTNSRSIRLVTILDSLPLTSLPGAYDLIAPAAYGAVYEISRSAAKMEAATVENRLDEVHATATPTVAAGPAGPSDGKDSKDSKEVMPPPEHRLSVFTNGSGEFVSVGNSFNASGYNFDSGAATVGIDYRFTEHFVGGILLNYTGTTADLVDNGRINANAFRGGAYASVFGSGAYVNAFVGGAYTDYDVNRAGLGSSVHGDTSGGDFNALISTGYDAHAGNFTFGPVGSFQYTYSGLDAFNERGSLDPLHVNAGHGDSFLTNVGARASYDWHIGSMVLVPEVRATWQHEYGDIFDEVSATMLVGSPAFTVTSSPIGRDSLVLNAGFTLRITPDLSAYAFYDGELARTNYEANNVMVGFRASF